MLGSGILKGMAETARNFLGSYTSKERLVTVEYPEQLIPPKENARNIPFLIYDGPDPDAGLRCVACLICEKECPPQCIYIVKDDAKKPDATGRIQAQPRIFDIDISVCMGCQICVEVCPFDSIKMDTVFELSTTDRFEHLLLRKHQLAKSNEYYHKLHPADADESDARIAQQKAMFEARNKPAPALVPSNTGSAARLSPAAAKPVEGPPQPNR